MKKLIIALFAFAAMFAVAGSASASDYLTFDEDVAGATNTYGCYTKSEDGGAAIHCYANLGGTVTDMIDVINTPAAGNVLGGVIKVKYISTSEMIVYYTSTSLSSSNLYLNAAKFYLSAGPSPYKLFSNTNLFTIGGTVSAPIAVAKDIDSSTTYPTVVWRAADGFFHLMKDAGAGAPTQKEVITSTALANTYLAVIQDATLPIIYAVNENASTAGIMEATRINYTDPSSPTVLSIQVSSSATPVILSTKYAIGITQLHSTNKWPFIVLQDSSDKAIKFAYPQDASSYASLATLASLTNNINGFDTDVTTGGNVAFYSEADTESVDGLMFNNTGTVSENWSVRDLAGATYGIVTANADGNGRAVVGFEEIITTSGDAYLYDAFDYSGHGSYNLYEVDFQQEGESIPELPGNTLWKVLIAVLALGLVVGVAAFLKKKKK